MTAAGKEKGWREDYDRLAGVIAGYRSMVVAFSGGIDSSLLAFVSHRLLGDRMVAVMGVSPSLAAIEQEQALAFLAEHRIPHLALETKELDNPRYRANGPDRCYHCKSELFSRLEGVAKQRGIRWIAYGANADDEDDYRPGMKAARERGVVAPLAEAGLGKGKIRALARGLGLANWDKPASPCLASRLPYFSSIDAAKLKAVERAEEVLKKAGFPVCRVRYYGPLARIEVPREDIARLMTADVVGSVVEGIKRAGFDQVVLDLRGFRSGNLNLALRRTE